MKKKLAILISGRGSNMEAIIEARKRPGYPAETAIVIADNDQAKGLETARSNGIETCSFSRAEYDSKREHEAVIVDAITNAGADIVCLAGFMRILSAEFVQRFEGRLINIHPSLLPAYKGLNTHARALEDGVKIHGCTVHFVNAEMDGGAIIAQAAVPVLADDDEDRLAARVLKAEHILYPRVVELVARGVVGFENGRAKYSPDVAVDSGALLTSIRA